MGFIFKGGIMDKVKRNSQLTRTIAEIAIFAALGYVLDFLAGTYSKGIFPNGGSIGIALICVFVVAFRRGTIAGVTTGLIMGLLDLIDGFYAVAGTWYYVFFHVFLDYIAAYLLAGFAGLFRPLILKNYNNNTKLILYVDLACLIGGLLKFLAHFLSGYIFWGSDDGMIWSQFHGLPALYSLAYNIAYMLPCIILTIAVLDGVLLLNKNIIFDNNVLLAFRQNKEIK